MFISRHQTYDIDIDTLLSSFLQSLPIPCVDARCKMGCCSRRFVPLTLAFARSIHKFQGLSAGPTDEGQIPNIFKYLIVDPGNKLREANCPGLLYTAVSRATTLGNKHGKGSALYFLQGTVNRDKFTKITFKLDGTPYVRVKERTDWLDSMSIGRANRTAKAMSLAQEQEVLDWSSKASITPSMLEQLIGDYRSALHRHTVHF